MKTPQKIKADELIEKYLKVESFYDDSFWGINKSMAVQCAKIAVEEIIKTEPPELSYMEHGSMSYWQEVLNCLNKM